MQHWKRLFKSLLVSVPLVGRPSMSHNMHKWQTKFDNCENDKDCALCSCAPVENVLADFHEICQSTSNWIYLSRHLSISLKELKKTARSLGNKHPKNVEPPFWLHTSKDPPYTPQRAASEGNERQEEAFWRFFTTTLLSMPVIGSEAATVG
jgi:hypothetical protein